MQRKGRWWRLGRQVIIGGGSGGLAVGRAGAPLSLEIGGNKGRSWVNLEVEGMKFETVGTNVLFFL